MRPLFAFYCTKIINNAAFRHRRGDVYTARLMVLRNRTIELRERWYHSSTAGRLIARWRHDRLCHRYGKGSCFNSTCEHIGSLPVGPIIVTIISSNGLNYFPHFTTSDSFIVKTLHVWNISFRDSSHVSEVGR